MTSTDFRALSAIDQENFINGGGTISDSPVEGLLSSPQAVDQKEQVVSRENAGCSHSSFEGVTLDQSAQSPVPPISLDKPDFTGWDFANPIELLYFCDSEISSGRVTLYDWQIQFMLDFAAHDYTDAKPFQAVVRACNGSGKDRYIIASCIVWMAMKWRKTICVVTSASGAQLDNQTCRYIKTLCESFNRKFQAMTGVTFDVWDCTYRKYELDFGKLGISDGSFSHIFCYATDEPKKAEGYHPAESGAKMGIFVSEDKSVPDEINTAINKCTGYTHRCHVSTPGIPLGHFHDYCNLAIKRENIVSIQDDVKAEDWIEYHIPASKCFRHLKQSYINQMERDLPGGKNGAAYRSQVDAEFGTTDEMVVIPYTYIWQSYTNPPRHIPEAHNNGGLDLSDGGDETVLAVRNGNRLIAVIPFKFQDTEDTKDFLIKLFKEHGLDHPDARITADAGGIGKPILNALKRLGWTNIVFVLNQNKATLAATYANRGTEVFFNMRKLLENREIGLINEFKLNKQLGGRYYKLTNKNIHQLLSKPEQKSKGYPSPDRADAVNLCFWNYKSTVVEVPEDNVRPYYEWEQKKEEVKPEAVSFDLRSNVYDRHKIPTPSRGKDFSLLQEEIAENNKRRKLILN